MPKLSTVEQFIKSVAEQPHDQVIQQFYTEDASIKENQNPPRIGRSLLVTNEKKVLVNAKKLFLPASDLFLWKAIK